MSRKQNWMNKLAASALLMSLVTGGVIMYPNVSAAAPADARKTAGSEAVTAIKTLQGQIAQATDEAARSPIRLKLITAYLDHGRPVEAVRELQTWLKNNPKSPEREKVMVTLIAAQRQSNEWDAAASLSRSFVREYPKSAMRDAVFAGLVDIARYGQNSPSGEASALSEWLAASPDAGGPVETAARMLRLAKLQEQVGAVADAIAMLQKFSAKFPSDAAADEAGWRAAYLMHDRLRRTAEAIDAGKAHLAKYPKRESISRDWQWIGELARVVEKNPEAIAAFKKSLAANPKNREAASLLLDTLARTSDVTETGALYDLVSKNLPGDSLVSDVRVVFLSKQLAAKQNAAAIQAEAQQMIEKGIRLNDTISLFERAAAANGVSRADVRAKLKEMYGKAKGWDRSELALRLSDAIRREASLADAQTLIENELKENPINRRELTRQYIVGAVETQSYEINAKKRTKYELDGYIKKIGEVVKPNAFMPELRNGLEDSAGALSQTKQKELNGQLRTVLEALSQGELAQQVDTVNRESRRDVKKAADALLLLLKASKEKPLILQAVSGDSTWQIFERSKPEDRERILPWFAAVADSRPDDLSLNLGVGEYFRRSGKPAEAVKYFARVASTPVTPQNGALVGQATGALIDIYGYDLKKLDEVEKQAEAFSRNAALYPARVQQERYRQLADLYGRQKESRDKQIAYYRKAADLGLSNAGYEAAKNLMIILPPAEAVELGQKLMADPANARYVPEIGLMVAQRQALGLKDLPAAVETISRANQKRLIGTTSDFDNWGTFRELLLISVDLADGKRVSDPQRKAFLAEVKPLSDAQFKQLLSLGMQWLNSQQLHDVAREVIRREGAAGNLQGQLDVFSQVLARTKSNDQWHWDRNMEIIRDEISRGNEGAASTMLRLLLKQSAGYNETARTAARSLLLNTYKKFGEDLLAVDEKSPLAPLLRGASYLRLGEEKTAWELYQQNSEIFAKRIDEIPSEYVLFVGNELAAGSDTDRDAAEQLLRTWLARADKQQGLDESVRASVQLSLADVFYFARRFDVARAEYQSVIDKFPDTPQSLDAQFRIGESFMYQKNYVEAGKVFEKLRKNKDADVAIRGTFMAGVLQYTSGAREEARDSFKMLLELSPSEDLASKALYQLALIYGDDNRFREMLDMLEAIGRLGREGKRWHTPGTNLTVMIHDPDMAIVQGATSVPVLVSTTNGDREVVTLTAGSAGKGIYLTDLATALGAPKPGDGTLQLLGSDIISYDYPDDFKSKFKYVPPPQGNIRIASDGTFAVASTRIADVEKKSMVQRAEKETKIERQADEAREFRSSGEVKPGNPLYVKVVDPDRSTNVGVNRVEVIARAASGDSVRMWVNETSANNGVFEGMIRTAERPPEAIASDSSLGKPAGMAADKDAASAWESQHDGQPGKWIAADLKDVYSVKEFSFTVPDTKKNAPISYTIETSNNGTMWSPVISTEKGRIAHGLSLSYGPMRHSHFAWSKQKADFGGGKSPDDLAAYMKTVAAGKVASIDAGGVSTFALPTLTADAEADVHSYVGYFYAPTAGKYTFIASTGQNGSAALVIDGRIVAAKRADFGKDGLVVDLASGWHRLAGFITVRGEAKDKNAVATGFRFIAPGSRNNEPTQELISGSGDRGGVPAPGLFTVPAEGTLTTEGATTKVDFSGSPISGRFVRLAIEKYDGDFVAVSNLQVKGVDGKTLLPTEADVVAISDDDVLQVSPGDEVSVSYSDQINTRTPGEARILSGKLRATYFNGSINAITYDVKSGPGGVVRTAKSLYRIDSGDRIVATITDYDEDTSPEVNKVAFKVRTESGAELTLEATETEATSGTFTKEIETGEGPGKLVVKPGERIYLIYNDKQNTSPGSRTDRVAEISVVKPTQGIANVVPTRVELSSSAGKTDPAKGTGVEAAGKTVGEPRVIYLPPENGKAARVVLAAPLTIEVIDQDAAKDSHSSVVVTVTTSGGAKVKVPLELSSAARAAGSAGGDAVVEGRFVGQALMILGKPDASGKASENVSIERARGLIGAWRYGDGEENRGESGSIKAPILPVLGSDTITVTYTDKQTPSGETQERTSTARMVTDASIANLDRGFLEPVQTLHLGEKLYLKVEDADRDATSEQDEVAVTLTSASGEKLEIKLKETLGHSGTFTAEIPTTHSAKPDASNSTLEANFGDTLTVVYVDESHTSSASPAERALAVKVALGADAAMTAFTKQFGNEEIAVETQFKLAECYFELFKSHNTLKASAEARAALEAGRAVLATVRDNYRGSNYEARVLYLLGGFHQELKEYEKAIECYQTIIRAYSNNAFAPDAQYKLAQCYEDKNEMEKACEEYVRLAYTYPDNPLIAKCMVRLSDYFYKSGKFLVAANICGQFLEQYGEHEWAPKIAFRQGQCYFKGAEAMGKEADPKGNARTAAGEQVKNYIAAAKAFDLLVDRYTDSDLRADAMFWSGQSYHKAGDAAQAYRRYRRCTWDFPDSDAARYARGQLTLPEMLTAAKEDSSNK